MFQDALIPVARYGPMHGAGWGGGGGWFHFFPFGWGGILILIGVILLIVALVRRGTGGETVGSPPETALDVLKKRYARGEITREEFQSMKNDIEG
jgi:putative membrane protein